MSVIWVASEVPAMSKSVQLISVAVALVLSTALGTPAMSQVEREQDDRLCEEVRANPVRHENRRLTLLGEVTQYVQYPEEHFTGFYYIRDDFGCLMRVRTSRALPDVGQRYSVTGVVDLDRRQDVFLTEEDRASVAPAAQEPQEPQSADTPIPAQWWVWVLLGVMTIFVGITYLIYHRVRRTLAVATMAGAREPSTAGAVSENNGHMVEGRTVRFYAPAPGTLKILPGRFEVVSGEDKLNEIRFYKPPNSHPPAFTFGRAPGPRYTHFQLTSPTVSKKQARLEFHEGTYTLHNFSTVNPTRVNGVELDREGASTVLKNGDRIDMGEVSFVFHAS